MAKTGDYYVITLKKSHLNWGTHRYTGTRGDVLGEGYIPIPREYAVRFNIVNSNALGGGDQVGKNLYRYRTEDNSSSGYLKAQGCNSSGDIYAKQFSAAGDLKAIGSWYAHIGAEEGMQIKIEWTSPSDIVLSVLEAYHKAFQKIEKKVAPPVSAQKVAEPKVDYVAKVPAPMLEQKEEPKLNLSAVVEGATVTHKKFGAGTVTKLDKLGKYITVKFSEGEKKFVFPDAFKNGFLKV